MAHRQLKLDRLILDEVRPLVEAAGGECWIESGKRTHQHLCIKIGKIVRITPISSTPRADDKNAVRMKVADVRRILREMGH